jgi:hypothetical protein
MFVHANNVQRKASTACLQSRETDEVAYQFQRTRLALQIVTAAYCADE